MLAFKEKLRDCSRLAKSAWAVAKIVSCSGQGVKGGGAIKEMARNFREERVRTSIRRCATSKACEVDCEPIHYRIKTAEPHE
jgi:hypothetical protein